MPKSKISVSDQILSTIYGNKRGWAFTPGHFKHLGSRDGIASALKRLKQSGRIRQLARGLYDYPERDPDLGILEPSVDAIARALAGRDAVKLQPSGAYAANLLGLSTQIPMKVVYLTDGRSRRVKVGNREITLKQTTPRNMATARKVSGLVIQALRHIGKEKVDKEVMRALAKKLSKDDRTQLMKDIRYCPAWIADIFRTLSQEQSESGKGKVHERTPENTS